MAKRFLGKMDNDSYKNGYKVRSTKELRPTDKEMMVKGAKVLFSCENGEEDWVTLEGLFEGEMPCRDNPFIPLHEIELVDLCGKAISEEKLYSGDFHPDNIRFERASENEDVDNSDDDDDNDDDDDDDDVDDTDDLDEWICPDNGDVCICVYRNPNPPLHCFCQKKIPEYDERLDYLSKKAKNSPAFSRAGEKRPRRAMCTRAESRWISRYGKRNRDLYKESRCGGGRLPKMKARKLSKIFDISYSLISSPRVAIVNGTPEQFPLTRRRQIKRR